MKLQPVLDLFHRYPRIGWLKPEREFGAGRALKPSGGAVLAVQATSSSFFVLLFRHLIEVVQHRHPVAAEGVVVRSINAAIGTGWVAHLKRSFILSHLYMRPWLHAFGGALRGVAYRSAAPAPWSDLVDSVRAHALWKQAIRKGDLDDLTVAGICVGDLIVDSCLRFTPTAEFDVARPFVRTVIWQALRDVRKADLYFGQRRVKAYLTSHTTYLEHGIATRAALKHGVAVWSFGSLSVTGKRLSPDDAFHTPNADDYRRCFEALPNQDELLAEAERQLNHRLSGGVDPATSYMRQSAYAQSNVPVPEGLNGAVVIFLHDFYDSPHVYADLVFRDFWRWVCFTIDTLREAGIPLFIKPHPNQIALGDAVLERLRQRYHDLRWLPPTASNTLLAKAGIACGVTVYGTVAHELAYLGVPSVGCARHPHHAFDFCRTAHDEQEYRALLINCRSTSWDREAMRRQALAFFVMHNMLDRPGARQLQRDYAALWKLCDSPDAAFEDVKGKLSTLLSNPDFLQIADQIALSLQDPSTDKASSLAKRGPL